MISRQLLAIIGRRIPSIYDVIPRGPLGFSQGKFAEVALNPQPLPPLDLGAAVAMEFVNIAWLADRFGLNKGSVSDELDDWCPTPGHKIKLPPHWPAPDPDPHPSWLRDYHLGFAARLASVSDKLEKSPMRETFDSAVQRSLRVVESGCT